MIDGQVFGMAVPELYAIKKRDRAKYDAAVHLAERRLRDFEGCMRLAFVPAPSGGKGGDDDGDGDGGGGGGGLTLCVMALEPPTREDIRRLLLFAARETGSGSPGSRWARP